MKKVEAFIRHEAFEPIRMDLLSLGFPSLSISEVKGSGRQRGITERYRGAELTNWLRPKVKIECVVASHDVKTVVDVILRHARTGEIGRLRAYAGERCAGRVAPVPPGVAVELPIASGAELLGLVVLLGSGGADERALERLRLVAVAALTEIALSSGAVEDDRAAATLLGALAGGASLSREEIARRGARAGCDLRGGFAAVCCDLHVERPHHVAALVRDAGPGALA